MGHLCIYLPPFASDYSGVRSALFDLHCLTAINDTSCYTAHYVHYDEPQWDREVRPVLCTTLRNTDTIFGSDDKIVAQVNNAAQRLDASMIAIVGTPVPAIIGIDTVGIANEIEALSGRVAFGFNTTGFSWCDKGVIMAGRALIDRFAATPLCAQTPSDQKQATTNPAPARVNIVGITPLDFGDKGNDARIVSLLEDNNIEVGARFFMGLTVKDIEHCGEATLNLAVSAAGIELAQYLKKKFNTPYLVGFPVGGAQTTEWLKTVKATLLALQNGENLPIQENKANLAPFSKVSDLSEEERVLIVADQVIGNSVRRQMQLDGENRPIDVATFFTWHADQAEPNDRHLPDEATFLQLLRNNTYKVLIADPLLLDVPLAHGLQTIPLVHPAVSGKLHWKDAPTFVY